MTNIHPAVATRNAIVAAISAQVDAGPGAGTAKIYSGPQPATGDTALSGNTLLATVVLTDPAFGAPSNGVITGGDPSAVTAVASGTASWFRMQDSTGANVYDGDVSDAGGNGDMKVPTTSISSGLSIDVTSLTITAPA